MDQLHFKKCITFFDKSLIGPILIENFCGKEMVFVNVRCVKIIAVNGKCKRCIVIHGRD